MAARADAPRAGKVGPWRVLDLSRTGAVASVASILPPPSLRSGLAQLDLVVFHAINDADVSSVVPHDLHVLPDLVSSHHGAPRPLLAQSGCLGSGFRRPRPLSQTASF